MKPRLVALALFVAGCSSDPPKQPAPRDHWVLHSNGGPQDVHGLPYYTAWRINSETGKTEFCTFDPGGDVPVAGQLPRGESLDCTAEK